LGAVGGACRGLIDAELGSFLQKGVAAVVATRDSEFRPEITRGWGPVPSPDGRELALCLSAAPDSIILANLEDNGEIAVTFSLPSTYRSVQAKGRVHTIAAPTSEQAARVDDHIALFLNQVVRVGLSRERGSQLAVPPFVAVSYTVRELYDQTPGATAGARL
jgi:hypothetical protein